MTLISVHPIDRYVGQRVKALRIDRRLSQTALGEAVGITFQQIQKYEAGTNRISASRLFEIATVLSVPVRSFFDGVPSKGEGSDIEIDEPYFDWVDLKIVKALSRISDHSLKEQLLKFILGLADRPTRTSIESSDDRMME